MTAWPLGCDCPISIFRGTVEKVDPEKAKARVNIPELKGPDNKPFVTDPLPVVHPWTHGARFFSLPQLGAQAYVVFLDKGHIDGFVLGSRYSDKDPAPQGRQAEELFIGLGDKNGTFLTIAPTGDPAHYEIRLETMGRMWIQGGKCLKIAGNDELNFYGREVTSTAWIKHKLTANELAVDVAKSAAIDCRSIAVKAKNGMQIRSSGSIKIEAANKGIEIQAAEPITIRAPKISIEGDVTVRGSLTVAGAVTAEADATVNGALSVTEDAAISGKSFLGHVHTPGIPTTSPPV